MCLALGLVATVVGGCHKDKDESKPVTREGRVTGIDMDSGIVEMSVFSPKVNQEIAIRGTLAPECEILVNGAVAARADVKVGDSVKVTARRVKKSETEMGFIALKVEVDRPFSDTAPSTTQPTVTP